MKGSGASVVEFVRYEVGAGIDKKQDDFVGEVMAQVNARAKDGGGAASGAGGTDQR